MRDFSERCLRLRTKLKKTQGEFAELLGIKNKQGKITVARWESGAFKPSADYLLKFVQLETNMKNGRRKK